MWLSTLLNSSKVAKWADIKDGFIRKIHCVSHSSVIAALLEKYNTRRENTYTNTALLLQFIHSLLAGITVTVINTLSLSMLSREMYSGDITSKLP